MRTVQVRIWGLTSLCSIFKDREVRSYIRLGGNRCTHGNQGIANLLGKVQYCSVFCCFLLVGGHILSVFKNLASSTDIGGMASATRRGG
jgi:hypothetical protein